MQCKCLSINDLARHVPIYRNRNYRKMRPQFRKLHFRKQKTQQRTFNNARLRSKLQNWDIFVEIVSNDLFIYFYLYDIWTASSEFGTYSLCEQRRFRRACASAQSRQNLRCSLIQAVSQEEPSDRKPDPWPR